LHCHLRVPVPPIVLVFNHEVHNATAQAYKILAKSGSVTDDLTHLFCPFSRVWLIL